MSGGGAISAAGFAAVAAVAAGAAAAAAAVATNAVVTAQSHAHATNVHDYSAALLTDESAPSAAPPHFIVGGGGGDGALLLFRVDAVSVCATLIVVAEERFNIKCVETRTGPATVANSCPAPAPNNVAPVAPAVTPAVAAAATSTTFTARCNDGLAAEQGTHGHRPGHRCARHDLFHGCQVAALQDMARRRAAPGLAEASEENGSAPSDDLGVTLDVHKLELDVFPPQL
jgi:hypothetical protein